VVQRLQFRLQNGPISVSDLRSFLGNPHEGGGPEDLEAFGDAEAFVRRHYDRFWYDAGIRSVGLRPQPASAPVEFPVPPKALKPSSFGPDTGSYTVVEDFAGLVRMRDGVLARCGSVPLLSFVTFSHKANAIIIVSTADECYLVDCLSLGFPVVVAALQPVLIHPGVVKAVYDLRWVATMLKEYGATMVGILDVRVVFEHLTGTMEVGVDALVAAFGIYSPEEWSPTAPSSLTDRAAARLAKEDRRFYEACKILISATKGENWNCILTASKLRAQYAATSNTRRIAFDHRCGYRLSSYELLPAVAFVDVVEPSEGAGILPLILDVVVGRPDLSVLLTGQGDCGATVAATLCGIASLLSESYTVLLVGSPEFVQSTDAAAVRASRNVQWLAVPDPECKGAILMSGANVHGPQVVIVDEIASHVDATALCTVLHDGVRGFTFAPMALGCLLTATPFFPLLGMERPADLRQGLLRRTTSPPVGCVIALQPQKADECTVTFKVSEAIDYQIGTGAKPETWWRSRDSQGILIHRT